MLYRDRTFAIGILALLVGFAGACPEPPGAESEVGPGELEADAVAADEVDAERPEESEVGPEVDSDIEVTASACAPDAGGVGCDDGNPCSDDGCDLGACVHTPNIAVCDDGDGCTAFDRCGGGTCSGMAIDCDDGESCTRDGCSAGVCGHTQLTGPCDDESLCTAGDHCEAGVCVGAAVACPGAGPCATATCEPRSGCSVLAVDEGAPCDDGNACTSETACVAGVCRGALVACGDDNPCTDDYCDPLTGCGSRPNAAPCDDHDRCTLGDTCTAGACAGTPAESCCVHDAACDDGDACTEDRCDGPGCVHVVRSCDDGDACTRDACDGGACVSTAWAALPEEGQVIEDFEGELGAWTFVSTNELVAWRVHAGWAASGAASLYCGDAAGTGYDHGATRALASLRVLVPPGAPELHLAVKSEVAELGSCIYDALTVLVDGAVVGVVCGSGEGEQAMSLAAFEGREIELALVFDTVDDVNNAGLGVWVDRLRVTAAGCR